MKGQVIYNTPLGGLICILITAVLLFSEEGRTDNKTQQAKPALFGLGKPYNTNWENNIDTKKENKIGLPFTFALKALEAPLWTILVIDG